MGGPYRPMTRPQQRRVGTTQHGPERWVRELEEETGAVCIGRSGSRGGVGAAAALASGAEAVAAPSSAGVVVARANATVGNGVGASGRSLLPDFAMGSYEETLKLIQREAKIGCVILVSEEHDDVAEFKRFVWFFSFFPLL